MVGSEVEAFSRDEIDRFLDEVNLERPGPSGALYARTLAHFSGNQLFWNLVRRIWNKRRVRETNRAEVPGFQPLGIVPPIPAPPTYLGQNRFCFLNKAASLGERIDWHAASQSRLWRYNLHYFDYLLQEDLCPETASALLQAWIDDCAQGTKTAWEPYPVSLRTVNWIKYFWSAGASPPGIVAASLHTQGRWLAGAIEYHLQANHLLKNAKALVFLGSAFDGEEAAGWLKTGTALFGRLVERQFHSDGGHYETSPMYHAIAVEDMLDVLNLVSQTGPGRFDALILALKTRIKKALAFFRQAHHPDGSIALLADSAIGIAPSLNELVAYAARLSIVDDATPQSAANWTPIEFAQTGYFGYRSENELLLIDCGRMGPVEQPGHAHCDLLSFELSFGGAQIVVDSGTFDYEATPFRHYLRSTMAHNTVRLDRQDQSEIWSAFRIGRRANPISAALELGPNPQELKFVGAHDGFRHLHGRPVHRRTLIAEPGRSWQVIDALVGGGHHMIESYLHFHPQCNLVQTDECVTIEREGKEIAKLRFDGFDEIAIRPAPYCPAFGRVLRSQMLIMRAARTLPVDLSYTIERTT